MTLRKHAFRIPRRGIAIVLAGAALVGSWGAGVPAGTAVQAATMEELKAEQAELQTEKENIQAELDRLEQEELTALDRKVLIDQKMDLTAEQIELVDGQIAEIEEKVSEKEAEVENCLAEEEAQLELYKIRIRAMEEGGAVTYYQVLFGATGFADLLGRIDVIREVMNCDEQLYDRMVAAREESEAAKARLQAEQVQLEATREEYLALQAEQEEQLAEANALITEIEDNLDLYNAYADEISSEEDRVQAEIDALVAEMERIAAEKRAAEEARRRAEEEARRQAEEEARRQAEEEARLAAEAAQETEQPTAEEPEESEDPAEEEAPQQTEEESGESGEADEPEETEEPAEEETPSEPEPAQTGYNGSFIWPCNSSFITSEYGYREHPIFGDTRFHSGIDIGISYGSSIFAAASGTVITSTYSEGYGNYVVLYHDDSTTTLYAHMSERLCSVGDYVSQGSVIGLVGSTGYSTGPHLHFEVRINGGTDNPLSYLP